MVAHKCFGHLVNSNSISTINPMTIFLVIAWKILLLPKKFGHPFSFAKLGD
jgi:hypothetical protein